MSTAHGVARLFARRRGAGERLKARQVEQKKPVRYIMDTSKVWGISILAGLDLAGGCGKQSGTCHFQSGPNKSPVRSNTIPDFRDITVDFVTIYSIPVGVVLSRFSHLASTGKQSYPTSRLVMIPRCRKTRWLERVGHGPACAHGDTACFRILT